MKSYLRYPHVSLALCILYSATLSAADKSTEELMFALPSNDEASNKTIKSTPEAASGEEGLAFVLPGSDASSSEVADKAAASDDGKLMFELPTEGESSNDATSGSTEGDLFILPEFTVSTTQDRGYFSANTLSGTRTNQLIKDTPMTISVVNQDLMEDLNLTEISNLEKVVASIQDEGEAFTNSVVRFRGLLTKNQLFEFMQRKLGQDSYNVERVEVVRGANSLVYGQAAPGGKANYLAKKATFGDDGTQIKGEIGEDGLYRGAIDHNMQINDQWAVRFMGTYYARDYSQDFKSKTLDGQTVAISYRPTNKTQFNLHLERYFEERISPRSSYLDRTGEYGLTGILEDLPGTPDIVKYLSKDAMDYMINYNDGSLRGSNGVRVPQLDINSAEDLRLFYSNAGINEDNFGYGSPDLIRDRYGIFLMGDVTHQFTDDLALKAAFAHEEYNGFTQQLATSGDLFLSATSRAGLRNPNQEPNSTPDGSGYLIYDGVNPDTMPSPYILPTWEKSYLTDNTDSMRTTLSWNKEIMGSEQQFILGLDYDRRESTDIEYQQVLSYAAINPDGSWDSSVYRARDYVLLSDYHNGGYTAFQEFNYTNEVSPNYNTNANHSNDRLSNGNPGFEATNSLTNPNFYALRSTREAVVDTKAIWMANQGRYMNGRLNTLLGIRFDYIDMEAVSVQTQALGINGSVPLDETYTKASPSIGALYWVNENFGLFANYAQSIESPTGWVIDPLGQSVPAETGTGVEAGVKFELMDGKLSGQLTFFDITKENDSLSTLGTSSLMRLYPYVGPTLGGGPNDELYTDDGAGFNPYGRNVAGIDTNSSGIELDVYYNPTNNLSFFLGYAFSDALFKSGPKDPATGGDLVEEGQRVPGTAQHSANFTARYNFKEGTLKGWHVGCNLQYRSKSYYNRLYADVGSDSRYTDTGSPRPGGIGPGFYDGRPDLFPNVDFDGTAFDGAYTESFDIWLSDSFETGIFFGWSGRLFNHEKDAPKYSFQFAVDNLFDERDLIASGNNARYTDGRRARLKFSVDF
ncbi:MAG: TonB-dependent receptor [Opitutales bacterium]|jgi:outer membrane receptor protein involved in Fe transport|nr:TonB-dependent receptor [Opitutales bacterium]MDP4644396.1 TonB-dependent receptor [Opitutales bacterium]MDP4777862.1 TonB-dependent receptor [Opitutales bacterium]MDP5079849.1 TonB-dependent receptor [Opitutales bacterium]